MPNVGIIGLGMMGRIHYEAYQEIGATVIAVADQNPQRARGDLSGTGGNVLKGGLRQLPMEHIRGMTRAEELIAMSEVDIVDVCLPTTQHVEVVVAALRAGKNVICEKPLARTAEEGERIVSAAKQARGVFMPAMCMRFWPQWAWLKQAVVEKRYGAVRSAAFRRLSSIPAGWFINGAMSGGAALDLHIHDTDFVQFLFGTPKALNSRGYIGPSGEIDHLSTQFIYDDVPLVVAEGGWAMSLGFPFTMQYTVNFEHATADYDLARGNDSLKLTHGDKTETIDAGAGYGYVGELRYFVDCVKNGQKPAIVTAEDAVRCMRLIEAEVKSCRLGQMVRL